MDAGSLSNLSNFPAFVMIISRRRKDPFRLESFLFKWIIARGRWDLIRRLVVWRGRKWIEIWKVSPPALPA
jgi:hypothetical protein